MTACVVVYTGYYYSTFDSHIVCAFPAASELVELIDEKELNVAEMYPLWRERRLRADDATPPHIVSWEHFWNVTRDTLGVLERMHVAVLSWS